jgi:hypothetical protein
MTTLTKTLAAIAIGTALATGCYIETVFASEAHAATTPFLPLANEAAPKLIVDAPLAEPLARGAVLIPYRTENFRILPVFGPGADQVSPRVGHLHITVDELPWHWADAGDTNTVVVVGLPVGEHSVRIEIAGPDHKVIAGETVRFMVPRQAH